MGIPCVVPFSSREKSQKERKLGRKLIYSCLASKERRYNTKEGQIIFGLPDYVLIKVVEEQRE